MRSGAVFWRTPYAYLDCVYGITIMTIGISLVNGKTQDIIRYVGSISKICLSLQIFKFLSLSDRFSYLIFILEKVCADVVVFVIIMLICSFGFLIPFWLLARNQLQFDTFDKGTAPSYSDLPGAVRFMFQMWFGEVGSTLDDFQYGEGTSVCYLFILFFGATFLIIIVLLNMLIAIMGDTFAKHYESKK